MGSGGWLWWWDIQLSSASQPLSRCLRVQLLSSTMMLQRRQHCVGGIGAVILFLPSRHSGISSWPVRSDESATRSTADG